MGKACFDDFASIFKGESTGAFMIGDDLYNFEIKENDLLIGAGLVHFSAGNQSGLSENRKLYFCLFSSIETHNIDFEPNLVIAIKHGRGISK